MRAHARDGVDTTTTTVALHFTDNTWRCDDTWQLSRHTSHRVHRQQLCEIISDPLSLTRISCLLLELIAVGVPLRRCTILLLLWRLAESRQHRSHHHHSNSDAIHTHTESGKQLTQTTVYISSLYIQLT